AITVDEGSTDTGLGLAAPTDLDGDPLTITVTGLPTLGTVTLADGTPVTNGQVLTEAQLTTLQYDAPADYNGTDDPGDFTYSVSDGTETVTGSTDIAINPINDPPVANSSAITVDEGSTDTGLGLAAPTDLDGDPLTITVTGLPTLGTVTLADGTPVTNGQVLTEAQLTTLQYDAPADYNGTDDPGDFTYDVSDGTETVAGSTDITINPNDPPVANNSAITVDEGSTDTGLGLAAPTDPDGDTLTITVTGLPTLGTVTLADGTPVTNGQELTPAQLTTLQYDAPADYNGIDDPGDFTYSVSDGTATVAGSTNITINPNQPPIANNDSGTTLKNQPATINITDNDNDIDGNIDPSTIDLDPNRPGEQKTRTIPGQGTFEVDDNGNVTFTP
ncbi:MAG: hypothetical protein F6K18_19855, partial [Okeania sp. SIO2C2]|uniref:Ig-like domain-containing protein n=1 Tax=Okeania sp. SIO2C2 TaxID=2607787 RepID=UPI0013BD18C8